MINRDMCRTCFCLLSSVRSFHLLFSSLMGIYIWILNKTLLSTHIKQSKQYIASKNKFLLISKFNHQSLDTNVKGILKTFLSSRTWKVSCHCPPHALACFCCKCKPKIVLIRYITNQCLLFLQCCFSN